MTIFETEAGLEHRGLVGLVIAVRVFQEIQIRSCAEIDAAIAERDAGREREAIGEHSDLVRLPIAIDVFENLDAVAALLTLLRALGILVKFHDPQPPAFVPRHRDGIHDLWFAGEEADFEALRHLDLLLRFERMQCGLLDATAHGIVVEHVAGRIVRVDREAEILAEVRPVICGVERDGKPKAQREERDAFHKRLAKE